jgi:hypothetical protein
VKATLTANLEGKPVIRGRVTHRLHPLGKQLMEELDPIQISHRSRPGTLMSNRLQLNELTRRVERATANMNTLRSISLPEKLSAELNSVKKDAFLKSLTLDMEHIQKYVKEHEGRSVLPGLKWEQLPEDRQFWSEWFEIIKSNAEQHMFTPGSHFDTKLNFGARARTGKQVEPGVEHYDMEEDRTRVVLFHPALTSPFAFMPNKTTDFYKPVFDAAMDLFEINQHVLCPFIHGGEVYGAACEGNSGNEDVTIILGDDCNIFHKGNQFAYDGVNWETQVGTILGPNFYGSKTYFGGMSHVPSGVYDTSLDDTLATMWILGSEKERLMTGEDFPGIMEREEMDETTRFMLGLSYAKDPNYPRLQGLKLSVDKADGSVILPSGRNVEVVSKYDEDTRLRWYLGYHGITLDGDSLLDFLSPLSAEEYRGGEVSDLVQQGQL